MANSEKDPRTLERRAEAAGLPEPFQDPEAVGPEWSPDERRESHRRGENRRGWEATAPEIDRSAEPRLEVRELPRGFEAAFSLVLTGSRSAAESHPWLLPPTRLGNGCSIDIMHRLDPRSFRCRIRGRARAAGDAEAREAARALWKDLEVSLCHAGAPYAFSAADPTPREESDGDRWHAPLRPAGLRVDMGARRPGFTTAAPSPARALLLDAPLVPSPPALDALAGLAGTGDAVTLTLSLERLELDVPQRKLVEDALRHLRKERDVLYANGRSVQDGRLLENVQGALETWRRRSSGFRLHATVTAARPISNALLGSIGEQLYRGDRAAWTPEHAAGEADSVPQVLDLRSSFPHREALPALLPSHEALASRGVATMHVRVPDGLPTEGLRLGEAGPAGRSRPVFLPDDDRKRHAFLLGATGTGKSTFMHHMIMQDVAAGVGLCLLDPHGDLHDAVLDAMDDRLDDLVVIEVGDGRRAVGINMLEVAGDVDERRRAASLISNEMIAIFDRLYDLRETGGPMFELYMRNTLLLVMENQVEGSTLLDVPLVFEDPDFRAKLLEGCTNPFVVNFWKKQAERAKGEASLSNIAPYVTSKLNQFTHNTLLRPILGQARSTVDFRTCMDEGKIVLVNLAKGLLGEVSSRLLGMLILGKLFVAAMGRTRVPAGERRPFHVYIDEAQEFTTSTAAHMMAEARKFGLHLTLASQTLARLSQGRNEDLAKALLGNAGNLMFFRLGAPDAQKMESYTGPELKARDLEDLANFNMAARLLIHGRPTRPFVFRTAPPPPRPASQFVQARREQLRHVREAFTRPAGDVERALQRRYDELSG